MTLNARLNLESLDGRWLPDATPVETPPTPPPQLALNPAYITAVETLNAAIRGVNEVCWTYAIKTKNVAESEARVVTIEVRIQQVIAAGGDWAAARAELAAELKTGNAARAEVAAAVAAYPQLVLTVGNLANLINLRYGTNFNPTLPALDAFVDIVTAGDSVPPPPGVVYG